MIRGGYMTGQTLLWAAVPHTGDGVVFELRLDYGRQRFYVPRDLLEDVFGLEPAASDARQLELFYANSNRISSRAYEERSRGSAGTVRLQLVDFSLTDNERRDLGVSQRTA